MENRPPAMQASEASSLSSPVITVTEALTLEQSVWLPSLFWLPCQHILRPSAPGGRSLNCLVTGFLCISHSLVPMQQGPLTAGPCGCCSSCLSIGSKEKSSHCSEPTLLKKGNKNQ